MNTNQGYADFYKKNWQEVYGFWHKIINRGEKQINFLVTWFEKFSGDKIRVLDLGCGSGDEILEAISLISGKQFEICANGTSAEALDLYEENLGRFVKKKILGRLEDLPEKIAEERFDLILFSHSLYDTKLEGLFERYLKLLSEEGRIVIFMDALFNDFKQIQTFFWVDIYGRLFDENVAEDIEEWLVKISMNFKSISFGYVIDIKKLLKINPKGIEELFIPFAMRKNDLNSEMKDEIALSIQVMGTRKKELEGQAKIITIRRTKNESC